MVFDPREPDIDYDRHSSIKIGPTLLWVDQTSDMKEELPPNMPEPLTCPLSFVPMLMLTAIVLVTKLRDAQGPASSYASMEHRCTGNLRNKLLMRRAPSDQSLLQ